MTKTTRILSTLALAAAMLMPQTVFGGSLIKRTPASDFTKFLPPLDEVPWLNIRSRTPTRLAVSLPEAGTLSALLLVPKPVTSWASLEAPSAAAGSEFVGM